MAASYGGDDVLASFAVKNLDTGEVMSVGDMDSYMQQCQFSTFHNTAFGGQPVTVKMERSRTVRDAVSGKDHTEYILTVTAYATGEKWEITKRYREFVQLHERLREIGFAGVASLSLPPKRLFDSLTAGVVARRRDALERYLNAVLSHAHSMREFPPLRFFLQVPERLLPFTERAPAAASGAGSAAPAMQPVRPQPVVLPRRPPDLISLEEAASLYPEYRRR